MGTVINEKISLTINTLLLFFFIIMLVISFPAIYSSDEMILYISIYPILLLLTIIHELTHKLVAKIFKIESRIIIKLLSGKTIFEENTKFTRNNFLITVISPFILLLGLLLINNLLVPSSEWKSILNILLSAKVVMCSLDLQMFKEVIQKANKNDNIYYKQNKFVIKNEL